ncbi:MAG TPA: dockerin [Polyangiaceae bacterium]|nr:dockerin [Polyangiaceae bacterium]
MGSTLACSPTPDAPSLAPVTIGTAAGSGGSANGGAPAGAGTSGTSSGTSNGGNAGVAGGGGGSAASGGSPAAAGAGGSEVHPEPEVPKTPPFGWVGIIGTGQSLAVGGGGTDQQHPISTTASYGNLKLADSGPDPKYPIAPGEGTPQWSAVPLLEPIRRNVAGQGPGYTDWQYPNNIQGETPHTSMASTLSSLFKARGGQGDYVTVHSVVGWAGRCLNQINKQGGGRAFPASLNEARVWQQLAAAAGKTYGVGAVVLTHGECDASNQAYGSGLYPFWSDYNTDIKALTGQANDVVLLASQQSATASGATSSAVQLWKASVEHPQQILCVGPKYQYQYGPDRLHMPATGYIRLGEKYAEVFDLVVNQKRSWKPLQPRKVSRSGAKITVDFDVPNPPLVWDKHLQPPHQQAHVQWAAGKGFEVTGQNNAALTIASVAIEGSSVVITLAADPGATQVVVGYALTQDGAGTQSGTVQGLRGLLRDSDPFVGADAEELPIDVVQGSTTIKPAQAGGFLRRTAQDVLTGAGVAEDTIVLSRESNDQLTLATPWSSASGRISASFHHEQANYCVHFSMPQSD